MPNKSLYYISSLIFLFICYKPFDVSAQEDLAIYRVSSTRPYPERYTYKNETKKLHEFESSFLSDPIAINLFDKYNNARTSQKVVNFTFLGITTVTILAIIANRNSNNLTAVGFLLYEIVIGVPLVILGNIITGPIKGKRKKKLINYINYGSQESTGSLERPNSIILKAGITQNGLTLSFQF